MNYAFFGSPKFAEIVLKELIAGGFPPTLVVCNPDKPIGRKKIITPPPTKILAKENEISIAQPETKEEIANYLSNGFDFFVVAAYSKILPKNVIELPKLGVIGVHPSLLPKYRGATPIQSAILAGEAETGTSLFMIDEKVDNGSILAQKTLLVEQNDYRTLEERLAHLSGKLLAEILPSFIAGKTRPQPQNDDEATFTKKFTTEDGQVDLSKDDPVIIERKVRALNPEPGVWTIQNGRRMKILEAELKDGKLMLKKIQFEGGTPRIL
ncbi:MAG: methionyl-tRNA formyltransferase [Parcubacteria group bacterium Gr01-1014_19]|nr:MAG: methionyl-tRNA formyltransferase [Parcubacteria group bacterium Gr01-1014_19]